MAYLNYISLIGQVRQCPAEARLRMIAIQLRDMAAGEGSDHAG